MASIFYVVYCFIYCTSYFAGADVAGDGDGVNQFRYPSYVQHIMGDIFSLGFGPFRWVCTSCDPDDLDTTDQIAAEVMENLIKSGGNVLPCVMRNAVL